MFIILLHLVFPHERNFELIDDINSPLRFTDALFPFLVITFKVYTVFGYSNFLNSFFLSYNYLRPDEN